MTLLGVTEVVVELKRSLLDHGVPICQERPISTGSRSDPGP